MRNLGRGLLLAAALAVALVIGVLIGRGQRAEPISAATPAAVQITTAAPPAAAPPAPLPAPVRAPPPVAIPKIAPDLQVQEDAAAVGMTTRDQQEAPAGASNGSTSKPAPSGEPSEPIG